ncbi:galactose mutarotase-like protein [Tilletiaria anomala UBC 951]|uniref:Galactose mutarotase-like protein n=1 Tax=Tilletiaria anomala (strain ATCC 24038 / CBS 436.72 / UBC 951) TaxID=1037660 RepID=A0A066VUB7_TILAU|nr:galactose mutarotase-like protein [Tilletiaria anomala UBC 951]KDN45096.1 galactose mutarotase-like protein [Tilletiaria anomala UBC 951]
MTIFKLAAPLVALALTASAAVVEPRQAASSTSSSTSTASAFKSTSTASSNTSTAPAPGETPGFVLNGAIGSYPCAVEFNPLAYSPFDVPGCANAQPPVYPANQIRLRAPDDSIRATFLPYGAAVNELWVKDRWGQFRDIALSYDNSTNLISDPVHPNFGPVVGRYANRIKNGTFELNNKTYNTPLNENNIDTLHGGTAGYDRSSFKVVDFNSSWVRFSHNDPAGNQGFPGEVNSTIDYWLEGNATWRIAMNAIASTQTPIMLSSHGYWNLDAYNESQSILNYTMHMPQLTSYVETDTILIPTGPLPSVKGTPYDFRQPTVLGDLFNQTTGVCGFNCTGWDSCFINGNHTANNTDPVFEIWSPASGIRMSVVTDQVAMQVYTCPGINNPAKGSLPRKRAHGGNSNNPAAAIYDATSCFVFEAEGIIDAINNPSWNENQIYGPDRPYTWNTAYTFSTVNPDGSPAAPVGAIAATSNLPAARAAAASSSAAPSRSVSSTALLSLAAAAAALLVAA